MAEEWLEGKFLKYSGVKWLLRDGTVFNVGAKVVVGVSGTIRPQGAGSVRNITLGPSSLLPC